MNTVRKVAIHLIILLFAISSCTLVASAATSPDSNVEIPEVTFQDTSDMLSNISNEVEASDNLRNQDQSAVTKLSLKILNEPDFRGRTALMTAIIDIKVEQAISMIKKGVKLDSIDKKGLTALVYAVLKGEYDVIEGMIGKGVDVNQTVPYGYTPLMVAITEGQLGIVELLIENGADLDILNEDGVSAMDLAIWKNEFDMLKLLVDHGASLKLYMPVSKEHAGTLKTLIRNDATEMIDLLVEKLNLDLNATDSHGSTALHYAYGTKNDKMLKYLIAKKVNLDAPGTIGTTILNSAVIWGRFDTAKLLIEGGATIFEYIRQGILRMAKSDNRWATLLEIQPESQI